MRSRTDFLDEWATFQRPALQRMLEAGAALVEAMDDYRATSLRTIDLARHDSWAIDHVGGLLDHLGDELGAAQRRADDLGLADDLVALDLAELERGYERLKGRVG